MNNAMISFVLFVIVVCRVLKLKGYDMNILLVYYSCGCFLCMKETCLASCLIDFVLMSCTFVMIS